MRSPAVVLQLLAAAGRFLVPVPQHVHPKRGLQAGGLPALWVVLLQACGTTKPDTRAAHVLCAASPLCVCSTRSHSCEGPWLVTCMPGARAIRHSWPIPTTASPSHPATLSLPLTRPLPAELLYSTSLSVPNAAWQRWKEGSSWGGTASAKGSHRVLSLSKTHALKPAACRAAQSIQDMSGTDMCGSARLWLPCRQAGGEMTPG